MKRTIGVTIIGWFVLLQGVVQIILSSLLLSVIIAQWTPTPPLDRVIVVADEGRSATTGIMLLSSAYITLGVFAMVSGVGMLRMRAWAWLMAMIIQGIAMTIGLFSYFQGEPSYLEMLFSVVIVFYLNQRDIQRAFSVAQHQKEPTSLRTVEADRAATAEAQATLARRN
jgi:uncharacterized membrane protein (DUF2068 family)